MLIFSRQEVPLAVETVSEITTVITGALKKITTTGDEFIVNDTVWYRRKRKGGVSSCVLNAAGFLSRTFQKNLEQFDSWNGETTLEDQSFDGYGLVKILGSCFGITEEELSHVVKEYIKLTNRPLHSFLKYFNVFHGMYVTRRSFSLDTIPVELHRYFMEVEPSEFIRVGVEFETGNIGSSFRSLMKLNILFARNLIDLGVFITSNDKENCAARIWPASNRNGSFTELDKRNYFDNVYLPLLEFGFAPDAFSKDAPYLHEKGYVFKPKPTKRVIEYKGTSYRIFAAGNKDNVLLPEHDEYSESAGGIKEGEVKEPTLPFLKSSDVRSENQLRRRSRARKLKS